MLTSIGSGLLFTIHPDTPISRIIGFQILLGLGLGGARQNVIIATQTEYAREEHLIPQATSVVNFLNLLGGIIGLTVGAGESWPYPFDVVDYSIGFSGIWQPTDIESKNISSYSHPNSNTISPL